MITQHDVSVLRRLRRSYRLLEPWSTSGHIRKEHIDIHSVTYKKKLEASGYVWGKKSANKAFPHWMLRTPRTVLRRWLQAFFDAEGSTGPYNVELTTASAVIAEQLQYALLRFGIRCAHHTKQACATNSAAPVMRTYHRLHITGEDVVRYAKKIGFGYRHKQEGLEKTLAASRNPNYGVPVRWLLKAVASVGLSAKSVGVYAKSPDTASVDVALGIVAYLRRLANGGVDQVRNLGGTAKKYAERTAKAVDANRELLKTWAARLETLATSRLRFEPVYEISPGERGGLVFDLEIDSDNYAHKNYVGGDGAFVLHNTLASIGAKEELGVPAEYVVPAPLQENIKKEFVKHTGEVPEDVRVRLLCPSLRSPRPAVT
jgi:hypothetical protein